MHSLTLLASLVGRVFHDHAMVARCIGLFQFSYAWAGWIVSGCRGGLRTASPYLHRHTKNGLAVAGIAFSSVGFGAVMRTVEGNQWAGAISCQTNGLAIITATGQSNSVPLNHVSWARFAENPKLFTCTNGEWKTGDIGEVRLPGSMRVTNGQWRLSASGWGLSPYGDALRVATIPMPGEGQVVGRVSGWDDSNGTVIAGITLRESLEPGARHASLFTTSTGAIAFVARGTNFVRTEVGTRGRSTWLRLARMGDRITGYLSANARDWEPVDSVVIPGEPALQAGALAATLINSFSGSAEIADLAVTSGTLERGSSVDLPTPSVLLRDGSILAGTWKPTNNAVVVTLASGTEKLVRLETIAGIFAKPIACSLAVQPAASSRAGVMLRNLDWLEGEISSLNEWVIKLSSTLLGNKQIAWGERPAAIVLAGVKPVAGAWRLELKNGSCLYLREVRSGAGCIRGQHPDLGEVTISMADLLELWAPGAAVGHSPSARPGLSRSRSS